MRTSPFTEFQTALYTLLTTDGNTSGYTTYSEDAVPLNATFPYLTIRIIDAEADDAKNTVVDELTFAIKVHTRSVVGEGGPSEVFTMSDNVMKALTTSTLSLVGNHVVTVDRSPSHTPRFYISDTGAHMHREVTTTGRYRVQDTE